MQKKKMRFYGIYLTIGLIIILALILASCSSTSTSGTTPTSTGTTTPTTPTTSTTQSALTSINVAPASPDNSAKLGIGARQQFTATGTYADNSSKDISSQVTWNSSDNSVAIIDSNGVVTGAAAGTAAISASQSGINSSTADLMVIAYSSIAVTSGFPADLKVGYPGQFIAIGTEADGATADITSQVTWSSSNPGVASIDLNGVAVGAAEGTTGIAAGLAGINSSPVSLTVTAAPASTTTTGTTTTPAPTLASIAVTPGSQQANIEIGRTLQFKATGVYSDSSTVDITSQVAWTSSDNTVATINSSGVATGIAAGFSNITATLFGKTSPAASLLVITPLPPLSSIALTPILPDNSSKLTVGSTQRFTATGIYTDGSTMDITSVVTWTSSTTATATVDTNGLVTGVAAGTTDITVSLNGKTSQAVTVTVIAAPITTTTGVTTTSP